MRDDFDEKPSIPFSAREVQPETKSAKAKVEGKKGPRSFGPALTATTQRRSARPWPFTPRAEPAISFGGPVGEEKLNLSTTCSGWRTTKSLSRRLSWLCRQLPLHPKIASTLISSPS